MEVLDKNRLKKEDSKNQDLDRRFQRDSNAFLLSSNFFYKFILLKYWFIQILDKKI